MGKRLTGFDYSRPYFYMVTFKCRPGRQALSEIVAPGTCRMNPVTRAMVNCIRNFHLGCKAIAPVECFTIMADHVHCSCGSSRIPSGCGSKPSYRR